MKRSAQVRLLLMGSAAVALAGCGDDDAKKAEVYSSINECIAGGVYTEKYCRDSFEDAQKQHPQVAPKYSNQKDCEADFGPAKCQPLTSSDSSASSGMSPWIPAMAGFLVGQVVSNLTNRSAQPLYRPDEGRRDWGGISNSYSYSPGSWRTGGNVEVSRSTGSTTIRPSSISPPSTTTTTISRGGFGARASSVGISGGG